MVASVGNRRAIDVNADASNGRRNWINASSMA
jgi:hypothetical protein